MGTIFHNRNLVQYMVPFGASNSMLLICIQKLFLISLVKTMSLKGRVNDLMMYIYSEDKELKFVLVCWLGVGQQAWLLFVPLSHLAICDEWSVDNDILPAIKGVLNSWTKWPLLRQTTISDAFSWMKMVEFRFDFHWKLFPGVQLLMLQHWFR